MKTHPSPGADREAALDEGEAGFTLVEVLVAFIIIALTLTMALRVLADGAAAARRGPDQAARVEEAASLVDSLVADPKLQSGETEGAFTDGSRWYARVVDVTSLVAPKAPGRLFRIEFFTAATGRAPLFVTMATGPGQ